MVNDKAEKMCYNVISKKPKGSGDMKHKLSYKIVSAALSAIMVVNWNAGNLFAKASNSKLPYISEVFIAYGKTEQEAKKWLVDNGWEPVDGDLNAGKNYALADDVASVMGIKRTADPNDAITDMAVMNMYGGYSFGDYEALVNEKKTEINEFIMSFVPANRTFTKIPVMIVDEADIVTYLVDSNGDPVLDEKGNQKKNIDFNQFAYYQVVKCNRQAIGIHPDAQSGVSDYESWGCGDAADLNCDIGKQWLALYTIKNPAKGDPIFADSLKVTYGEGAPNGYTESLHFFCYTHAMNLGDTAFAFNNDKNGVYLYWKSDKEAYTASSFSKGYVALAGIGGLIAGILGTTFALYPRRKKEIPDAPVAG